MIPNYLTSDDWKSAKDRFDFCADIVNASEVKTFAEIGVWKGELARILLTKCPSIERYYMVDPWKHLDGWNKPANVPEHRFSQIYDIAMKATDFAAERRFIKRKTTLEAAKLFSDAYLDAIYIDGDHTLRGISLDLISLYPKIKNGGLILGDDLSPSIWQHPDKYEPSFVFPFAVHFAEAMNCPIIAGPYNQFAICKTPEAGFSFTDLNGDYPDTSVQTQLSGRPP